MIGGPAKNVKLPTPGQSINVYVACHQGVTQEQLEAALRRVEASDVEELGPGMLTAKIDGGHYRSLEQVAEVQIMDEKAPKAQA
jgi:hypothetical protein